MGRLFLLDLLARACVLIVVWLRRAVSLANLANNRAAAGSSDACGRRLCLLCGRAATIRLVRRQHT